MRELFKDMWKRKYLPVIMILLMIGLFAMPVSAAGKSKVVTLKAGQTCYVVSKDKSTGKKAGSIGSFDMEVLTSKTKFDLIYTKPEKNKLNTSLQYFEAGRKKSGYYEKKKGNNKFTVTCTSGTMRITIKNYTGQVSIKKSSTLPYEKKTLKAGKKMTLKRDLYYLQSKVGTKAYLQYPASVSNQIEQLTFANKKLNVKIFASKEDYKAGDALGTSNHAYDLKKGKKRDIATLFDTAGMSIHLEKGSVTVYRIKQ